MKHLYVILIVMTGVLSAGADAIFSWDFTGNEGPFDFYQTAAQITTNDITFTFTAVDPEDDTAVLNAAAYFGVNSNDDSDTDTVEIGQYITITFSSAKYTSIKLQVIDTGAWSGDDAGYYQIDGGSQIALTGNAQVISPSVEVLGSTLTFASTNGNGISLNGITVEAIPEPATMSLIGLAGLFVMVARRIRLRA